MSELPLPIDAGGARRRRRPTDLFALGLVLVTALLVLRVVPAWRPDSLFVDDEWVLVLARDVDLPFVIREPIPVAPGFVGLLRALARSPLDPHWSIQVVPALAAVAMIWVTARLARAATGGSAALGLMAGAVVAGGGLTAMYAVRAKQYTLDGLATAGLLALAWRASGRTGRTGRAGPLALLVVVAVVAPAVSFTSLIVGAVAVNACAVAALVRNPLRGHGGRALGLAVAYDLAAAGWAHWMSTRSSPVLRAYWQDYYAAADPVGIARFLAGPGSEAVRQGLPAGLTWAIALAAVGLASLWARRQTLPWNAPLPPGTAGRDAGRGPDGPVTRDPVGVAETETATATARGPDPRATSRRLLATICALIVAGALAASVARAYPLGGGRTDLWLVPVWAVLIAAGVGELSSVARGRAPLAARVGAGVLTLLAVYRGALDPAIYPASGDRAVVGWVAERARPDDALLIQGYSNWPVACYGPWPAEPEPARESTNGFILVPRRPLTYVPRQTLGETDAAPAPAPAQLAGPLLEQRPARVIVLRTMGPGALPDEMSAYLARHGYEPTERFSREGAVAAIYARRAR